MVICLNPSAQVHICSSSLEMFRSGTMDLRPQILLGSLLVIFEAGMGSISAIAAEETGGLCHSPVQAGLVESILKKGQQQPDLNIPIMLQGKLMSMNSVCEDARRRSPEKRYAVLLLKSHGCDDGSNACMSQLLDVSDPCNLFIKQFSTYQTRILVKNVGGHFMNYDVPCQDRLTAEWNADGKLKPSFVVIDTVKCKSLGQVTRKETGLYPEETTEPGPITLDWTTSAERFEILQAHLLKLGMDVPKADPQAVAKCLKNTARPKLVESWKRMEQLYPGGSCPHRK